MLTFAYILSGLILVGSAYFAAKFYMSLEEGPTQTLAVIVLLAVAASIAAADINYYRLKYYINEIQTVDE